MLLAALGFAVLGLLVRVVSARVPASEIVLWRSAATGGIVLAWAVAAGRIRELRPVRIGMHGVRAAIGVASMFCYFQAIARLGLGDAVLLTYVSPLIVAALSPLTVGERPSPRIWTALGVGLVGVALVVGPRGRADPVGIAFGAAAAWLAAGAYLSVRVLNRTEAPLAVVWWFSALGAGIAGLAAADGLAPIDAGVGALLVGIGAVGALAQWALTLAYRQAPAASVSVYAYATPVFAYVAGLAVLGEVPAATSVLGAAAVALAGAIAARDAG